MLGQNQRVGAARSLKGEVVDREHRGDVTDGVGDKRLWEANIDLTSVVPSLDLYDQDWPIWSYSEITAPAKFVHNDTHRRGAAINSLVAGGGIVSGSHVEKSLLFTGVKVHSFVHLDGTVVQPYAEIGRRARLRDVVIDRGVVIPAGLVVGEDAEKGRVLITQPMIDKLPE